MKKVPLTKGFFALVDDDDFESLSNRKWVYNCRRGKNAYAQRSATIDGIRTIVSMHRVILNPPIGMQVDHINGDGLDNRKVNLRVCTHRQNIQHQTRKMRGDMGKGVYQSRCKTKRRFQAVVQGKFIGTFDCPQKAKEAYDKRAKELFGEFACP